MQINLKQIPAPLWILFINTFTMAIGFFMLIPLLAKYLLEGLILPVTLVGIIVGVRGFFQQGLMLAGGFVSDRLGYKTVICWGVFIRAIGFILFGFVESVPLLLIAAVLSGLGGAFFHPSSFALYTIISTKENRATVYSIRDMLSNVGFIFGPVIGAMLLHINFKWVCIAAGIMFLIVFFISLLGLPNYIGKPTSMSFLANLKLITMNKRYTQFCLIMMSVWFLTAQLYIAVPVKLQMLEMEHVNIGLIYSTGAIVVVLFQVPLINMLSRHYSAPLLIAVGSSLIASGLLLIGLSPTVLLVSFGVVCFSLGQMFVQPMMSKQISEVAPIELVASFFGFNGLALAVGGLFGNLFGGYLFDLGLNGYLLLPWVCFAVIGFISSILMILYQKGGGVTRSRNCG
ncbi:MFS transporter [Bacillus sp. FJAT-50079]|uniref:MFS transporter n=1 Tax=Bacillus sp. FJAT-50079 TaxID=2833577 RepID=UPI001BCA3B22|nr:MFS transporter [Bacillus sp. FJAT-50079]MBS4208864.1 MFS transporter [Bacillus sp. FJAT-50079]